eukprot:COSAG02_NODE_652_length_18867_cov_30.656756_8_plen_222_part_00
MTSLLVPDGGSNVLAVRVNNTGANSRWYSGSGLFRPVSLLSHPATHIATWGGVYITTPNIKQAKGDLTVEASTDVVVSVRNDGTMATKDVTASVKIYRSDTGPNTVVATGDSANSRGTSLSSVPAGGTLNLTVSVPSTKGLSPWGPSHPVLYTAEIALKSGRKTIQTVIEEFGYRSFSFDAKSGFTINGEQMKLYGGCVHHDNGPLGSRAIARAVSDLCVH